MFELSPYHLLLVAFGGVVILAYWLPRFVSGREPAASALLIGLGYAAFGWIPGMPDLIDPIALPKPWEIVSELCVVAGLFGVGLRIDRLLARKLWTPTVRLLAIAMPLCILAVAVLGMTIAGMTMAGALLLAAVLAPTDPVLAGDVQVGAPTEGGEHPVRFSLTTEAGLNDGLAFPFVYLALAIAASGVTAGVLTEWLWLDVGYRIAVGALSGAALGWLIGKLLFAWPGKNPLADTESGVIALAGVMAVYGLTELVEGYGFIAAFVSGLILRRQESGHKFHTQLHDFTQAIEHALTSVLLIALGAALPALLPNLTMAGAAIGAALLFLIRPSFGWLALIGTLKRGRERAVVAFYGVRGIGSVYYLAYAGSHAELVNEAELWAVVAFTILLSTVVHGFTAGLAVERVTENEEELAEAAG
ncbi:cation:proton antiporter [Sphingomonas sp. BN140010]|uniref:Cation:proton antiporter n=1 Tax=Sphingomonas arvum TaxID=2992113 RepID=A0ABT3JFX3_9SPHN|nr:cation:proton antiporter [Sphingomonas sp. BN140010]MCW3797988.1 cation:proton antiporter [Sphingomonas sp. BN140010]